MVLRLDLHPANLTCKVLAVHSSDRGRRRGTGTGMKIRKNTCCCCQFRAYSVGELFKCLACSLISSVSALNFSEAVPCLCCLFNYE